MSPYQEVAEGLNIFWCYTHTHQISADRDQIRAGPDPATVRQHHLERLNELGWMPDEQHNCFYKLA